MSDGTLEGRLEQIRGLRELSIRLSQTITDCEKPFIDAALTWVETRTKFQASCDDAYLQMGGLTKIVTGDEVVYFEWFCDECGSDTGFYVLLDYLKEKMA